MDEYIAAGSDITFAVGLQDGKDHGRDRGFATGAANGNGAMAGHIKGQQFGAVQDGDVTGFGGFDIRYAILHCGADDDGIGSAADKGSFIK